LVELDDAAELDDEPEVPLDDEPFDELEVDVVPVDGAGETACPVAGLLPPFVGGDGLVVAPVDVVPPVEPLAVPPDP
jgi:hypothetical protein